MRRTGDTMRAAILETPGQPLVIADDVDIDEPGRGQVRVAVSHCGVCHSDLSVVNGSFPAETPIVLGHEATGVVESVGEGVTKLSPGDPVVLTPCPPCGTCYWCVRSEPGACENSTALFTNRQLDGTTGLSRHGQTVLRGLGVAAFAEYVITSENGAVKIPEDVPLDVACVIGCAVQTGVGAVLNTARVEAGATVLVMGLGGIGLSIVQGARVAGAARILASDPLPARRETAKQLGATDLLDPTSDDVPTAARELTGGIGVDYAFECVGSARVCEAGIAACRNGGTTVAVGAAPISESINITPAALFTASEKKLVGCLLGSSNSLREVPRLIALWQSGQLDLEKLITNRRPLAEINEAMEDLAAGRGIRTVLTL
jgi:S-(hydroxymethyl)glutathione dehydrogenase/alcohol dehydrogenase